MVKTKAIKLVVCVLLVMFLSVMVLKGQQSTPTNYQGEPRVYGEEKNVLVVLGNQTITVKVNEIDGVMRLEGNKNKHVWYNHGWYKDLVKNKKNHSHNFQKQSTSAYLLECESCGEKSFDYDYLSQNWQKIKGVKERLDSSMVIVYVPSEN